MNQKRVHSKAQQRSSTEIADWRFFARENSKSSNDQSETVCRSLWLRHRYHSHDTDHNRGASSLCGNLKGEGEESNFRLSCEGGIECEKIHLSAQIGEGLHTVSIIFKVLTKLGNMHGYLSLDIICSSFSQFSSRFALGKLFASRNR